MKQALQVDFHVPSSKVSVIPFGINNTVPDTELTRLDARSQLGLIAKQKVLLFFGNIAPYKGLDCLVDAFALLANGDPDYRLVIAGRPKGEMSHWQRIESAIRASSLCSRVIKRIEYVPDADTEIYFKAADIFVLPYTHVFQSGVLFLGYNFGLPVIASDVGSLRDDIIPGKTGFLCRPRDSVDLANCISRYFSSDLYENLDSRKEDIRDFARERYSWAKVGEITQNIYRSLLERPIECSQSTGDALRI
jgi:glycosyltransferase involved in cell wall biosynthesis